MRYIYTFLIVFFATTLVGCKKFLDRPQLSSDNDETAWTSEQKVRLYVNEWYPSTFIGYNTSFATDGAAFGGFTFSDDVVYIGNQSGFSLAVPNSSIWGMGRIRSINLMLDRVQNRMQSILTPEAFDHWVGIGRFFRAMEYAELVTRFGDVPYYDELVGDTELDKLYKPRTPRNEVMDAVYDDLKFAMEKVRTSDGDQFVNRYVVAGFASRIALYEGTWQKYYYSNNDRARKFLELAVEAGDLVMNSGKYDIVTEFRTLFTSNTLAGNQDVVFYRHYDAAVSITHSIATLNNLAESIAFGATTDFIKSFICADGSVWQNSTLPNASNFSIDSMIKTRDPRLEATFYDNPTPRNRASYWYVNKFVPRSVAASVAAGNTPPPEFSSNRNVTDYPVFRYAEALLNWIESKAELSTLGGSAVTQDDINRSINKIRNRPIAAEAVAMGVKKTAAMDIDNLPNDPERDPAVPALIWEIRRERRMEFAFEYSRYEDLKRWKKLNYMDTDANPELLSGGWVNFPTELPSELVPAKVGQIGVVAANGTFTVYSGTNSALMRGFFRAPNTNGRRPFLNIAGVNPYLAPVGRNQIEDYESKGYVLAQTEGWATN